MLGGSEWTITKSANKEPREFLLVVSAVGEVRWSDVREAETGGRGQVWSTRLRELLLINDI